MLTSQPLHILCRQTANPIVPIFTLSGRPLSDTGQRWGALNEEDFAERGGESRLGNCK